MKINFSLKTMKFIIFHGSFGSAQGNWFPQLKEKLESLKQKVILPQFPVDDWNEITKNGKKAKPKNQTLDNWFNFFEKNIFSKIKKEEKLCFIGHSLGPLFILHLVDRFNLQLDCAIFVSPFFEIPETKLWQIDLVNKSFYKKDFDFEKLKKLIPVSYVLYSDNDPYVEKALSLEFAEKLKSKKILVKGGGHLNAEFGFYDFPLVFELCKKFI